MKQKYITPAIEVDELLSEDVLLTSNMPTRNGIYNFEDSAKNWTIEEIL